jgi:NEDD8-activating enzyme E1 regulatory subunit
VKVKVIRQSQNTCCLVVGDGYLLPINLESPPTPFALNMAETTPTPLLSGPTSKEKRYDRQLRLWAASGQQALEEAHVLLVNPSLTDEQSGTALGTGVVGVEALKNLVLPGIGNYTIVDDATVSEEDLGVNFFLEEESLGKSRAAETCRLLQELNPDVNGNFKSEEWTSFLFS